MRQEIKIICHQRQATEPKNFTGDFGPETARRALGFHRSFPEYSATPLVALKDLSAAFGVKSIRVKDESHRFGLNAFKGLGGSYCIGSYLAEALGENLDSLSYDRLRSPAVRERLGEVTFVTATDGNHGRGIAWTAKRLGMKSVDYLPKDSTRERLQNIRALGAKVSITELNYDDTVRFAAEAAAKNGWVLVQDTACPSYEKMPKWMMQGYTTMALEAARQLAGEKPTHIFPQAGVGAMAGALTGFFTDYYPENRPKIIIVEPNRADCLFRTVEKNDGSLQTVTGALDTIMAGLSCGEPCTIAWDILKRYADAFVSVPDWVAAKGMRILSSPLGTDLRILSGESGAVTLGLAAAPLQEGQDGLRRLLRQDENSIILCFSTEGDTDPAMYRSIVRDGLYLSGEKGVAQTRDSPLVSPLFVLFWNGLDLG